MWRGRGRHASATTPAPNSTQHSRQSPSSRHTPQWAQCAAQTRTHTHRREEMTGEVLNELRDPTWILDRRNSGNLFWRRDSASSSEKNRVKFRCDVEVVEYLRVEPEPPQYEDWSSDEEDERYGWRLRPWDQEIPPPSSFWGGVCMVVIAAVITYQWLAV